MKLLIISHTPHYKDSDGQIKGWAPTVRENDYIAGLFESVLVLGFLHDSAPPESAMSYSNPNITFKPLRPSGGSSFSEKLKVILFIVYYLYAIHRQVNKLNKKDWIYVRCPCNIGFLACLYLMVFRTPNRWFKYAGNWRPAAGEALSYRLQRFILNRNYCGGKVTVNGKWDKQPEHILSFYNPCFTAREISEPNDISLSKKLNPPFKFLFAGRIETEKGVGRILEISEALLKRELSFEVSLVGEGKDKKALEDLCRRKRLDNIVTFYGNKSKEELKTFYRKSHLFLFPSLASEGWPKVLSEAMNYHCVPIAGNISSIPQILEIFDCGLSLFAEATGLWVDEISKLITDSEKWSRLAGNGKAAMENFTYESVTSLLSDKLSIHG